MVGVESLGFGPTLEDALGTQRTVSLLDLSLCAWGAEEVVREQQGWGQAGAHPEEYW